MAKEMKDEKDEVMEKPAEKAAKDPRQARWENLLVEYQKRNPAKYAAKKERGEFNKIPDSFE